jgi:hypothetical protein
MKNNKVFTYTFLLTLIFIFILSSTFGQKAKYKPEMYIGLNGGMSASMINFSPSVSQSFLMGYTGGIVFRQVTQKSLGWQAELNYMQRGWQETDGGYARQLSFIELPFMTHFNFGNKFRFFFNIGPKIGYLISENVLQNTQETSTSVQHSTLIENKFDYGFTAGTGFYVNIKGQVFQLEARGNYSMSDIYSNAKRDYFDNSNPMYASVNFAWLIQIK